MLILPEKRSQTDAFVVVWPRVEDVSIIIADFLPLHQILYATRPVRSEFLPRRTVAS